MPQELMLDWGNELSLVSLLLNLGIGVILSLILRWHFRKFGSTLSNRDEFAQVFPLVLLTTILIISVVKSSLALSLGLVGALSIVRFRTPIKEPEELAYLFITIATGLGLGADQTIPTVIAVLVILGAMLLLKWTRKDSSSRNLYLNIDCQFKDNFRSGNCIEKLNKVIGEHVVSSDLRRFDIRQEGLEAVYLLDVEGPEKLNSLIDDLHKRFPSIGTSFLDQNQLPSL